MADPTKVTEDGGDPWWYAELPTPEPKTGEQRMLEVLLLRPTREEE